MCRNAQKPLRSGSWECEVSQTGRGLRGEEAGGRPLLQPRVCAVERGERDGVLWYDDIAPGTTLVEALLSLVVMALHGWLVVYRGSLSEADLQEDCPSTALPA